MKTRSLPLRTIALWGFLTVLALLVASPSDSGAASMRRSVPRIRLALVSEENLPAEELPSPGATASPGASTPVPGAVQDWRQVPSGANAQPGNQSGLGNDNSATGTGSFSNPPASATLPNNGGGPNSNTGPSAPATPAAPLATAETPPALDLSTVSTGPDLSNASLESEIRRAETPARAASLRLTEDARKNLADGRTADALRDLGRAVSIDPGDPFEYFYLGRAYVTKKNCEQALTFLKRAEIGFAARSDWLGQTVSLEGACYEDLGRTNDAAQAYQRALNYAPNNLTARVGYGRLAGSAGPVGSLSAPPPAVQGAPPPPAGSADQGAPEESPPLPPPEDLGGPPPAN
jgi:hypothetical protein